METLQINNLEVYGKHGQTGDEQNIEQPFLINVSVEFNAQKSIETDNLTDTIDYVLLEKIIRETVSGQSYVLLETLVNTIGKKILEQTIAQKVSVTISKTRARVSQGIPTYKATLQKSLVSLSPELYDFDIKYVLRSLDQFGGVSIPILPRETREKLLGEVKNYDFIDQPETVEGSLVKEELSSISHFRYDSLVFSVQETFQRMLRQKLEELGEENVFEKDFRFNEPTIQMYKKGSLGIETHKDFTCCRNLICVFILTGHGRFGITKERNKENPHLLDTHPGNVILLRAAGYRGAGQETRPFHFIDQITEDRIVLGFRQNLKLNDKQTWMRGYVPDQFHSKRKIWQS